MVTWDIFSGCDRDWNLLLKDLEGVNIYQTSEWGSYRKRLGWGCLRMVAMLGGEVSSAIQISVRKLPLGVVILWVPGAGVGNFKDYGRPLTLAIRKLFKSKIVYCRLSIFKEANQEDFNFINSTWLMPRVKLSTGCSLIFDTHIKESERLGNLSGNWRHNLKRSGKYGLKIEEWINPDPHEILTIYRGMEEYKGIGRQYTLLGIEQLFENVGKNIILHKCLDAEGNLIALRGCMFLGSKAWDLFAATTPSARKVYASHALFWALTSKCHELGIVSYDMSGADPVRNLGVYNFKKGTGAKDIKYLGEWEWSNYPLARIFISKLISWKYKSIG